MDPTPTETVVPANETATMVLTPDGTGNVSAAPDAIKEAESILKDASQKPSEATYTTDTGNVIGQTPKDMYVQAEVSTRSEEPTTTQNGVGLDTSQTDPRFTEPMATLNALGANPDVTSAIASAVDARTNAPDYSPVMPQDIVDAPPAGTKLPEWTAFRPGEKAEAGATPTLAEIKALAEKMRDENNQIALVGEAAKDLTDAVEQAKNEKDPSRRKKILGAVLGTVAVLAALMPRDGGAVDSNDASGIADTEMVSLGESVGNIGAEVTDSADTVASNINNPDASTDISKPISGTIFPAIQPSVGPETPAISQTGLTGGVTEATPPASGNTPPPEDPAPSSNPFFSNIGK